MSVSSPSVIVNIVFPALHAVPKFVAPNIFPPDNPSSVASVTGFAVVSVDVSIGSLNVNVNVSVALIAVLPSTSLHAIEFNVGFSVSTASVPAVVSSSIAFVAKSCAVVTLMLPVVSSSSSSIVTVPTHVFPS